jgi:hypothetical protein
MGIDETHYSNAPFRIKNEVYLHKQGIRLKRSQNRYRKSYIQPTLENAAMDIGLLAVPD